MTRKNKRNKRKANVSGQHLLHNPKIIQEIVEQAELMPYECAVDLGAGKGALTFLLAEKTQQVLAVENDQKFVQYLEEKSQFYPNIKVIDEDIRESKWPKRPFKVVSNIPYAITTPIMKQLLDKPSPHFERAVILMEEGAAKRFTSDKIKDPYVITWRMTMDIQYIRGVNRKNFSPPPKVDSAVIEVRLKTRSIVPPPQLKQFKGLAEYALFKPDAPLDFALEGIFTTTQLKHVRRKLKVKVDTPISDLNERQWGMLFESMIQHVPKYRWPKKRR